MAALVEPVAAQAAAGIDIDATWRFAEKIANSQFIRPKIRGDVATVFHVLCMGEDLGLKWTHAARGIYPGQSGGTGMEGNVILALLYMHNFKVELIPQTEPVIGCTCTITRPGEGQQPISRSFTLEDARRIKTEIKDRTTNEWWTLADSFRYLNYPSQMCQWRALANCGRVAAADVMGGIYLPEELEESTGGAAPAPEPSNGKPAETADEFVVGEKPEEPEQPAETVVGLLPPGIDLSASTGTISGGVPLPAENSAARSPEPEPTPAPPAEPLKPQLVKPAAKPEVRYHVYVIVDGKPQPVEGEIPQPDKGTQTLRARALANEKKRSYVVVKFVDGEPDREQEPIVSVCNPPTAALPKPVDPPRVDPTPAPTPEPKPTAAAQPTFDQLITLFREKIGGDPKAADKVLTSYWIGYLHPRDATGKPAKTLPKDKAVLTPPLLKLAEVIDARLGELKADPVHLGELLAGHVKGPLDQEMDVLQWRPNLREAARKVMGVLGLDESNFVAWLQLPIAGDGISIASLEPEALDVLLPLFAIVKARALEPVDFAIARGQSITDTLATMVKCAGRPIEEGDAPFWTAILDQIRAVSQKQPEPPAPEPEPVDDFLTGGLPFES